MTRTKFITSIASALGATVLFASAAQACISCEYVPEVLNASKHNSSHSYRAERSYSATIEMRQQQMARAQMAKAQMARAQAAKAQAAKAQAVNAQAAKARAAKRIETASITQNDVEPVTVAKPFVAESDTIDNAPAKSGSVREKTVSTATLLVGERLPKEEAEVAKPIECKKFIAAIGTTVTVPCK